VVRVAGYRSRGTGSIPGATAFTEDRGTPTSWVQLRSYLKEKVAASVKIIENMAIGIRHADYVALTSRTSGGRSVGIVRSRTQTTELVIPINVDVHHYPEWRSRLNQFIS
jgi:hypothetical protein